MVEKLVLPLLYRDLIVQYVTRCLPEEGCGLLGGMTGALYAPVEAVIPVENVLHSPVRFRMDPAGQLRAFQVLENKKLELVAIFHSHPAGPEVPSVTDIAEFLYPGVLTMILSYHAAESGWGIRAFRILGNLFSEIQITMV